MQEPPHRSSISTRATPAQASLRVCPLHPYPASYLLLLPLMSMPPFPMGHPHPAPYLSLPSIMDSQNVSPFISPIPLSPPHPPAHPSGPLAPYQTSLSPSLPPYLLIPHPHDCSFLSS